MALLLNGATDADSSRGDDGRSSEPEPVELILYVGSIGPQSESAINDIREILARYQRRTFKLTIRDLSAGITDAQRLVELLRPGRSGLARTCILGHLAQKDMIVRFLDAC